MYKINIYMEQEKEVYDKLIDYAISKSDAFMVAVYKSKETFTFPTEIKREMYESEEEYELFKDICDKNIEKINKEKDIFRISTGSFIENISPYLIKKRLNSNKWPLSDNKYIDNCIIDVHMYKVCDEIKKYLLQPKGLFNWKYPYYPDDLCFFKEGYCWFVCKGDEEEAYIYVNKMREIKSLEKMGLQMLSYTDDLEDDDEKIKLFYEEY